MEPELILQILLLIFLLCASAFFSASETSLMSLSKLRLRHMNDEKVKGAEDVTRLIENPSKLLGTILVGNNIANIAATSLSTFVLVKIFGENGVFVATIVMTVLILIFGEITPKTFASQKSEGTALKVAKPVIALEVILKPIVAVITFFSNGIIKLLGGKTSNIQPFITEEELKTIVDVSEEEGVLEGDEKEMIYNVFEFGDLQVKDIMIQRVDVIALDIDSTYDEAMEIIKREQFSRIPVYKDNIDDIVGILYVKDLVFSEIQEEEMKLSKIIRQPNFTYEFKKITELFTEMKKQRNHMAIVLDEYGGTVGIVTIEDLVEEIVGDISDEYDNDYEEEIISISENEFIVEGGVKLEDFNELIGTNIESDEFDSVGGFIIDQLGRFPDPFEEIVYNDLIFKIEEIDKNRIKRVRVIK